MSVLLCYTSRYCVILVEFVISLYVVLHWYMLCCISSCYTLYAINAMYRYFVILVGVFCVR